MIQIPAYQFARQSVEVPNLGVLHFKELSAARNEFFLALNTDDIPTSLRLASVVALGLVDEFGVHHVEVDLFDPAKRAVCLETLRSAAADLAAALPVHVISDLFDKVRAMNKLEQEETTEGNSEAVPSDSSPSASL